MGLKLREYQQVVADKILHAWETVRAVLAVVPTGGGKTVIFSWIMQRHVGACAAVVHRKEIVGQISCALAKLGVKHRVIAPPNVVAMIRKKHLKLFNRSFIDPHALAGVVSVQTLTASSAKNNAALMRWVGQITLCVFDEGHHYVKQGLWGRAVELMRRAKLLFVTATPERADGLGLGVDADGFCDVMVEGPSTQWLIDNGFLCRFTYKAPKTDLNMDNLPVTASGDVNTKVLRQRTVESHLVGDVVTHYQRFAAGKKTIVFASDVETAEEMAAAFNAAGILAVALSGKTDSAVRDRELNDFENGDLMVVVNVDLFDEGFDVPAVEAVILARITLSLCKYLQMVGRALRILAGKERAIVIDPVRNWERLGTMPNWPRKWTLDGKEKGSRSKSDAVAQRVCLRCTQPYEAFYQVCPYCGEPMPEPAGRSTPEQVDGDLTELDVDGMAALVARIQGADMSDDEFRLDMAKRRVPPIGHARQLRAHQAERYRRSVLRELVAWWVGVQPEGRELGEIHRRFYHRFGADIGTAFTLDEKQTDALIECVQRRFTEDMT